MRAGPHPFMGYKAAYRSCFSMVEQNFVAAAVFCHGWVGHRGVLLTRAAPIDQSCDCEGAVARSRINRLLTGL